MPPTLGRVFLADRRARVLLEALNPLSQGSIASLASNTWPNLLSRRQNFRGGAFTVIINEWGKFEDEIETCDFGPKNVCYNPQNWTTSAFRILTRRPHVIFEFRRLKEGLHIITYEWEKYELKKKTCDFGPKTVCYTKSSKSAIRTVTRQPHVIFEFRRLKEGSYIIMYEWEKYEVKMKTCKSAYI